VANTAASTVYACTVHSTTGAIGSCVNIPGFSSTMDIAVADEYAYITNVNGGVTRCTVYTFIPYLASCTGGGGSFSGPYAIFSTLTTGLPLVSTTPAPTSNPTSRPTLSYGSPLQLANHRTIGPPYHHPHSHPLFLAY